MIALRFIGQLQSGRLGQNFACLLYGHLALELGAHSHRMRTVNRHAHARRRDTEFRQMHDLARFLLHFGFFFCVTALEK